MIVGIKPNKQQEMWDFVTTMAPIMSSSDNDGLGYAAMSEKGLFIERWLNPKAAFSHRKIWSKHDQKLKDNFKGFLEGDATYNRFVEHEGANREPVQAMLVHARWATCEKALKNVHPFYRDGTALIHNGVISNTRDLKNISSTCDSECILNSYLDHGVNKSPNAITQVTKELRGSYACGVLTRDENGKAVMDIFKGSPNLFSAYIKELDALVFCTSATMVNEACTKLKWTYGNFLCVKDNTMARIDAVTGNMISVHNFEQSYYTTNNHYEQSRESWRSWENRRDAEDAKEEADKLASELRAKESKETASDKQAKLEEIRASANSIEKKSLDKSKEQFPSTVSAKKMELEMIKKLGLTPLSDSDPYLSSGISINKLH